MRLQQVPSPSTSIKPYGVFEMYVVPGFSRTGTGPPDRLRQGYGGPPKLYAKAEGGHYVQITIALARGRSIVQIGPRRTLLTVDRPSLVFGSKLFTDCSLS